MTVRCRRRPVVVLVDEAPTLARDVGQLLLNVSQEVRPNAPFLLVLAGTPGLPAHLGTMNASFWSRLGEGRLGIGLLREAATRTALFEPLAAHGVSIDPGAVDAVVEHSQRYPYFIQLWGAALWQRRLASGATRLTAAHLDAARPNVIARVTDYYQDRYGNWRRAACCRRPSQWLRCSRSATPLQATATSTPPSPPPATTTPGGWRRARS